MDVLEQNLKRYEWAREQRDGILGRAGAWLRYGDERLRTLVPPPEVPRARDTHYGYKIAPAHSQELRNLGLRPLEVSFNKPWKVISPIDGRTYPSNDFGAFMATGYEDRSLLTGPYPDDGWGCHIPGEDKPFWFVAAYAHWAVVKLLMPALADLSRAYRITGDRRFAHACSLLLWQMAEYYPRYSYEKQSRYGRENQPNYLGRLLYHTWEALLTCQIVPAAYGLVRETIDRDRALVQLTGQPPGQIRTHIEDRMLRTMANDIMDGSDRIQGNYGMHQVALLRIAGVLKHSRKRPTSREMVDYVVSNPMARTYTQLGLEEALANLVHRDGYPFESPNYNAHWIKALGAIVSSLGREGRRFAAMRRFRDSSTWPIRMACAGRFVPGYGDAYQMFPGLLAWTAETFDTAYRFHRDPLFAKALALNNASGTRDLFTESIEDDLAEAANRCPGPLGVQSQLLPGVGFASLQTGSELNRTALALFYGYYRGHNHFDRLQLDIYAWNHALTPDLGSEVSDSYDPRRFGFLAHTISHNTVMVNAKRQCEARGRLHVFDPGPFVQLVETSAEDAYPDTVDLYRRTLFLVEVSPDRAYVVDIFRVRGGTQHDWIVHGTHADFESDLDLSAPRKTGTLAGRDVPYGSFYDDARFDNNNSAHLSYQLYEGSGFQWLLNVQQARLRGIGTATWRVKGTSGANASRTKGGVRLRAHLIGRGETVYASDGVPPRGPTNPETIKFLIRRRAGKELESTYVTVFESYRRRPFIKSVRALPVEARDDMPVALEIACGGMTHILFNRLEGGRDGSTVLAVDGNTTLDARAALIDRTPKGATSRAYLLDNAGTRGPDLDIASAPSLKARVKGVNYERGMVTLTRPILTGISPSGGIAIVESGRHANAISVSRIHDARTFSVGDDDLSSATVQVVSARGAQISFYPRHTYFAEPGMTLVNERGKTVGRIRSIDGGSATLTRSGLTLRDFPDRDGDGRRTCRVVVVGPGDTVTVHTSARATV
jgi:hypothetical protein